MLTILADALMTASRNDPKPKDRFWEGRFVPPEAKREAERRRYRFSPYRDLW